MDRVDLLLPNGTTQSASLPLHPQLERQVRSGALQLVDIAESPEAGVDGERGAEHVSAPPPGGAPAEVPVPAGNAAQSEWAEYAVSQGMDPAEAAGLKRDEIKARVVTGETEQATG